MGWKKAHSRYQATGVRHHGDQCWSWWCWSIIHGFLFIPIVYIQFVVHKPWYDFKHFNRDFFFFLVTEKEFPFLSPPVCLSFSVCLSVSFIFSFSLSLVWLKILKLSESVYSAEQNSLQNIHWILLWRCTHARNHTYVAHKQADRQTDSRQIDRFIHKFEFFFFFCCARLSNLLWVEGI